MNDMQRPAIDLVYDDLLATIEERDAALARVAELETALAASEQRPAQRMHWACVTGTQVLVGDGADRALIQLMTRYSSATLTVMLDDMHYNTVADIRRYYKIVLSRRRRTARATQTQSHLESFEADQVA